MPLYVSVRPTFVFRSGTGKKLRFSSAEPIEVSCESDVRECERYIPSHLNRFEPQVEADLESESESPAPVENSPEPKPEAESPSRRRRK